MSAASPARLVQRLLTATRRLGSESALNVVAFSGGVDSSLASRLVHEVFPASAVAVLGRSPAVPRSQLRLARDVAAQIGIEYREVETREGAVPGYVANRGDACFYCKTELYSTLQNIRADMEAHAARLPHPHSVDASCSSSSTSSSDSNDAMAAAPPRVILYNGTNKDDLADSTRVGLVAADDFDVRSPLRGITKAEVRAAAKFLGLPNWAHAASPCLRSRLALGVEATAQHLRRIERAESLVAEALDLDPTTNMRVRLLAGNRAMIELDQHIMEAKGAQMDATTAAVARAFTEFTAVDVRAFQSGSVSRQVVRAERS